LGREVSRDLIGALRDKNMITAGPRSPTPGAPFTYVTTRGFLSHFGLNSLRDLPDIEALEDAGLLNSDHTGAGPPAIDGIIGGEEHDEEEGNFPA
jgi:chromosome segregation and condensation protein ScpB